MAELIFIAICSYVYQLLCLPLGVSMHFLQCRSAIVNWFN